MDILALLGIEQRMKDAKKESVDERYARIDIDLGEAEYIGRDVELLIDGDYMDKIKYDGSATGCFFRYDAKRAQKIYPAEFRRRYTPFVKFNKIFLTNLTAQTGKHFIFQVGGAYAGEIEPSTGQKIGLTDVNGVDMTPVKDDRFIAHTFDHIDRRVLVTIDESDPISGTRAAPVSLKVRWAIIAFDAADVMVGSVGLTNKAGAHGGVLVKEGGSVTVEHCDLKEIYYVNEDAATKPYMSVIYIKEA